MERKCDVNKHKTDTNGEEHKDNLLMCHYKTMRIRFRKRTVNVRKMSINNNYYSDSNNNSKSIDVIIMIVIILYFL